MKIIRFLWRLLMQRRVGIGLFLFVWMVVFCVPSLRLLWQAQVLGSSVSYRNGISFGLYPEDFSVERLAELYPKDLGVQVARIEEGDDEYGATLVAPPTMQQTPTPRGRAVPPPKLMLEYGAALQYDKLNRQHPKQAWLIALHLRNNLGPLAGIRLKQGQLVRSGTFEPEQLRHVMALAEQGRKLEPQNAFFDGALFCFLLAGYRDEEAFRVLERASRKRTFDDHKFDVLRNAIAIRERLRPLTLEEKRTWVSADDYQDETFDYKAHLIAALMQRAEQRGEHKRAIQVRGDLARFLGLAMQGRTDIGTATAMRDNMVTAWSGKSNRVLAKRMPRGLKVNTPEFESARVLLAARLFADYARQHNRADIAAETLRLGQAGARFAGHDDRPWRSYPGIPLELSGYIDGLQVISAFCLLQMTFLAGACVILSIVVMPGLRPQLEPRDVRNSLLVAVPLAAILSIGALKAIMLLNTPNDGGTATQRAEVLAVIVLGCWFLCPFLIGALMAWGSTLRRVWKEQRRLRALPPRYEGESVKYFNPPDHLGFAVTLCTSVTVIAAAGLWCASLVAWILESKSWTLPFTLSPLDTPYVISEPAAVFFAAAMALSAIIYLGWLIKWRWFAPLHLRPLLHGALRRLRQTLSIFIIVSSVFYVLFSIASLAPRRQAEARLDQYLKHGESSLLHLNPAAK